MTTKTLPPRQRASVAQLQEAAKKARMIRGEWLLLLEQGIMRSVQLFEAASEPEGKPLRVLGLDQVLAAEYGCSRSVARRIVADLVRRSGTSPKRANVGWLIDSHARGRRIDLWIARVGVTRSEPPCPEFPWGVPSHVR